MIGLERGKTMKCNYPEESDYCAFHHNGICTRDHNYECPALAMNNLSNGEMVQIAEGKKNKTPRYIDANRLIDLATHEGAYGYVDVHDIRNTPTADVVAVVRCRDCKWAEPYRTESGNVYFACQEFDARALSDDDYCSYGERKEKDNATLH